MIFKRLDTAPDFSDAHAYLAATRPQPALHRADQDIIGQLEPQAVG
jgi:hypothetical protein